MMKRIPTSTNIVSTIYKTVYEKTVKDEEGTEVLGKIDPCKGEISIMQNVDRVLKEKTWLHETFHGICKEINLKLTEKELDTLANVSYDTFTRNKIDFSQ
jgi:hypothetical protein